MDRDLEENAISGKIIGAAIKVHTVLGPGLLESAYEAALAHELKNRGLKVERQVPMAIQYESLVLDVGYRVDLLVENLVIVELKSVETIHSVHRKQALTYTRLSGKRLGLLLNFGSPRLKDGITRIANQLPT